MLLIYEPLEAIPQTLHMSARDLFEPHMFQNTAFSVDTIRQAMHKRNHAKLRNAKNSELQVLGYRSSLLTNWA